MPLLHSLPSQIDLDLIAFKEALLCLLPKLQEAKLLREKSEKDRTGMNSSENAFQSD